jgi:TonB family protein
MKQIEYVLPVQNNRQDESHPPFAGFLKFLATAMDEAAPRTVIVREVLIPEPRARWRVMAAATGIQIVIAICLAVVPILFPETFAPVRHYLTTALVKTEPIARWKPAPKRSIPIRNHEVVQVLPAALEEPVSTPRIPSPVPKSPLTNPIRTTRNSPTIPDLAEVATSVESPAPLVAPNLTIPTLKKPREGVQTGAFAGHDGVADGDSRGGLERGHGGVVNAKFAAGIPGGARGGTGSRAGVLQGSFSNDLAAHTASKPTEPNYTSPVTPVRITDKPRPAYTSEGRAKRIEGEVVLQVVFTSSGEVRVQSVLRGLGYGLDESAENAARRIKFQPAEKNGQPIDSAAVIHIVFELAY